MTISTLDWVGILTAVFLVYKLAFPSKLSAIPTIGYGVPVLSFITAFKWLGSAQELIQEGYEKHYGKVFKIATPTSWAIVVSGPDLINDFRRAADDELSFDDAANEVLQTAHTMHPDIVSNPFHVGVVRSALTKNLGECYDEVHAEIVDSIGDMVPKSEDWVKLPGLTTMQKIVARSANRLFVGAPLCRDEDYVQLNIDFTVDVFKAASFINLFPDFMKGFVNTVLTNVPSRRNRAINHLRPLIEERLQNEIEQGHDWPGKPNDAITWLIDEAKPQYKTVTDITLRLMALNFAAIHTTSMSTATTLYYIAANPQLAATLREEAEDVIGREGWSKASLEKFVKLDSTIKEALRCHGIGSLGSGRKVMKEYTFSDDTTVPAGATAFIATSAVHHDEALYPNSDDFDPMRFEKLKAVSDSNQYAASAIHPDYMLFGQGRHACPGRFLAVSMIKTILIEILLNYEIKFEDEGKMPPFFRFGFAIVPNMQANVLYRARKI